MLRPNFLIIILSVSASILHAKHIQTIYGECEVEEPILQELLQSQALDRLKYVYQYGVDHYIHSGIVPYTRYTHSLGVFFLLRSFGAPLLEQVAGLLHDTSHTAFSHVGDHVRAQREGKILNQNSDAYQDDKHELFLSRTDIPAILIHYGLFLNQINPKDIRFSMLERPLPYLCADRLEYNLFGGYIEGWVTQQEIGDLITSLHFENGEWFFDDVVQAQKLGEISIRLCQEIFASDWSCCSYENAAKALLCAIDLQLLTLEDIHFGKDDQLFVVLKKSNDPAIQTAMHRIINAKTIYKPASPHTYDYSFIGKFRGIDPFVKTDAGLQLLTQIDPKYKEQFEKARNKVAQRTYWKIRE